MEVRSSDGDVIIVDAGSGIRRLGKRLQEEGNREYTLLFSHAHWDHLLGFPFFSPIYDPKNTVRIIGCPMEQGNMQTLLAKTMSPPYFPVPYDIIKADVQYQSNCEDFFHVGSIKVQTIPLSHPNKGVGFRFSEGDRSFVFLTDNELSHAHKGGASLEEYTSFCKGADLLIHDAEYTPQEYLGKKGWGHSHYMEALDLALAAGVKSLGLFHHNQDRTDHELDAIVDHCRADLAGRGKLLDCFAVAQDMILRLE